MQFSLFLTGGAHAFEVFVQNHPFFGRRMDTRDQDQHGGDEQQGAGVGQSGHTLRYAG